MTKNRLLFLCAPLLLVCFALSLAFSNLGGALAFLNFDNNYATGAEERLDGVTVYSDEGYVSVSELFNVNALNAADRKFNVQNLKSLLSLVLGEEYTGIDQLKDTGTKTSKEMAQSIYGKDGHALPISVRFADLYWDVVYLSEDVNGDPILTLWLRGGGQYNWKTTINKTYGENSVPLTYNAGTHFGFQDGFLYSSWAATSTGTDDYPSNMYGTSYIRTMTLNSGGQFIASEGLDEELYKRQSNVFYRYTMPANNRQESTYTVSRFLEQPKYIPWQISGQSAKETLGLEYDLPNENCASDEKSSFASGVDYSGKNNYYAWADDYLWLPSLSEVGIDDNHLGLWEVSTAQKKNSSGQTATLNTHTVYNGTWLRSGVGETGKKDKSYFVNNNGIGASYESGASPNNLELKTDVTYYYAVRPAIHLNLMKAIKDAGLDRIEIDIDVSTDSGFYKNNVHLLYDTLSGEENTTYRQIEELAKNTLTSEDILKNTYNKNEGQYLTIKLGGLVWDVVYLSTNKDDEPILTLWLNSSKNDINISKDYSGKSARYSTLYTKWSSDWADTGDGTLDYPSNMYGTSYIRAVVLNNGGFYADGSKNHSADNATLTEYAQQTSYAFAKFTTASGSFTKFLEQPKNIPWQISGQSALPNEYCASGEESGASLNYAEKENYYAWGDDYLWLPSLSETGYDASHTGIWKTSVSQRYNHLGFDDKIDGSGTTYVYGSGKYTDSYIYDRTLLRSGDENDSSKVYYLSASGNGASTMEVYERCALRPALHLNLKKVAVEINDLYLLKEENITLYVKDSSTYTGSEKTVWVQYGSSSNNRLTEGEDYTITYENNINAGEATCTITGINDYAGVVTKNFTIDPIGLNKDNLELVLPESLVYTGDPIKVGIKYTPFNKVLVEDEDYTIEYDDNINAGAVNCTVTGKGNYEGEVQSYNNRLTFTIEKKELEESMLKGAEKYYVFNGQDVEFEFTLEYNGKTLKAGTDYKYEFYNNGHVNDAAQLRIEVPEYFYTSNFKGSFIYYFEIIEPGTEPEPDPQEPGPQDSGNTNSSPKNSVNVAAIIVPVVIVLGGGIAGAAVYFIKKKKK